ncbi:MAG: zf-HC2 domain-containing protein [Acidimicrobiia bacterium]
MSPLRRTGIADRPLSCREVGKVLQRYLDGHVDELTAEKVAEHLEDCRRCGLEVTVYTEIKASLARHSPELPETALVRLRRFGEELIHRGSEPEPSDRPSDTGPD